MEWAWLIPVFSFASALLIVVFGRSLPSKGAFLSILAIALGFAGFWVVLISWMGAGTTTSGCFTSENTHLLTCDYERTWFNAGAVGDVGSVSINWGILIDPLTIAVLGLVTFVALMVQIYSLAYMKGDTRFGWYFAIHSLFAAAMLTLVLADNFLLLYVAWELVGICSYLLIGFWHERSSAREAAKKAFIVTRIGDVGLLVGILLIWREVGTFSMLDAFEAVRTGAMSEGVTTVAALLLFLGAMGKSAQMPFHVWLPDAMEGPTPVSALIHAATMVIAGVYLVARAFPLFEAYDADALMVVSVVGLVTAFVAATIALVATDLKRILAYSTISHLGLMMLSLGAFGVTAAVFHMMAHGFSKALLFLGAGSVLHSTEFQETGEMGGLRKVMPITAILFSIGALSLGGIPILAGFWSKDEILIAVNEHHNVAFIVLTLFTAMLSALYMGRAMFLVFFGPLKEQNEHAHESPLPMTLPMLLLGILALGFGLISFNWPGNYGGFGTFIYFLHPHEFHFEIWLGAVSIVLAVASFIAAYLFYVKRSISLDTVRSNFAGILNVVENKYYFDEVYQWTIDRVVLVLSRLIAFFDRAIVNDIIVNGPADVTRKFGIALRLHVTGHVYSYILAMAIGSVGLALFVWWRVV